MTLAGGDMMNWYNAMLTGEYDLNLYCTYSGAFDLYTLVSDINLDNSTNPVAMQWAPLFEGGAAILELETMTDPGLIQTYYDGNLITIADECLTVPVNFTRDLATFNVAKIKGYDTGQVWQGFRMYRYVTSG